MTIAHACRRNPKRWQPGAAFKIRHGFQEQAWIST
jgi:hypothetical protein